MATDWSDTIAIADLADEPSLSEDLTSVIQRVEAAAPAKVPHVVLNLASVTYMNSSNLAQLLRLRKSLEHRQRKLRLCSLSPDLWSVFQVTGLDRVFKFAPDPMTALAGLQLEEQGP